MAKKRGRKKGSKGRKKSSPKKHFSGKLQGRKVDCTRVKGRPGVSICVPSKKC